MSGVQLIVYVKPVADRQVAQHRNQQQQNSDREINVKLPMKYFMRVQLKTSLVRGKKGQGNQD
jgi:hypothetical protein